jgi:hypothetical protein
MATTSSTDIITGCSVAVYTGTNNVTVTDGAVALKQSSACGTDIFTAAVPSVVQPLRL